MVSPTVNPARKSEKAIPHVYSGMYPKIGTRRFKVFMLKVFFAWYLSQSFILNLR